MTRIQIKLFSDPLLVLVMHHVKHVDSSSKLGLDFLKRLSRGSFNDVKILLEDGEILANKDVLSARCDYFATCFSHKNQLIGKTGTLDMSHCGKRVMHKIIHYLFR